MELYEAAASLDERIAAMAMDLGDEPPSVELARLRRLRHVWARLGASAIRTSGA